MERKDAVERQAQGQYSRRGLLLGGAAGLGGLGLMGASAGTAGVALAAGTGYETVPSHGPKRTVIWALAAIADWNLSYDVGFNDAVRFLGWEYRKVGVPIAQYSAASHIATINRAIQARPDVLVTPDWVEGVGASLQTAQQQGIYVVVNNALNFPDQISALGIAYVGADETKKGVASGNLLAATLVQAGKTSGTIITGNPFPQNANVQDRVLGLISAITDWNKAHHTSFTVVQLMDNSGSDPTGAIALWKAKITQVGPGLVALFASADTSTQAAVRASQEKGFRPGQYPIAAVDLSATALDHIKAGWVLNVIDAGFYMQGWLPVMLAWQALQRGYPTSGFYDASGSPITQKNLAQAQLASSLQVSLAKQYGVVTS
jgi:simple sugar transport system substrate-binding protein